MFRSFAIQRGSWQDLFVKRRLDYVPEGGDRLAQVILLMLMNVGAAFAVQFGPIAALVLKSENLSFVTYGQIVGITGLVVGFSNFVPGWIADRFGRLRVFLWGIIPATIFHFAMAFMPDNEPVWWTVLYVGMTLTEGWAIIVLTPMVRDLTPRTSRATGLGIYQSGNNISAIIALLGTGALLPVLANHWQSMFLVYGIVCLVILVLGVLFLREPTPGLRVQILHSDHVVRQAEQRANVIEERGVKIAGFWQFMRQSRDMWLLSLAFGAFLGVYYIFGVYGPVYLVQALNRPPALAASLNAPIYIGVVFALWICGTLFDRLRIRKLPTVLGCVLFAGAVGLLSQFGAETPDGAVVLDFVICGLMSGILFPGYAALYSEAVENASTTRLGTAYAFNRLVSSLFTQGLAILVPLSVAAYGWSVTWPLLAGLGIVAAVLFLFARGPLFKRMPLITSLEAAPTTLGAELSETPLPQPIPGTARPTVS